MQLALGTLICCIVIHKVSCHITTISERKILLIFFFKICFTVDWRVRPLVLIVKLWATRQDINDAKKMTISSYSLSLMVIHYLQCKLYHKFF